MRLHSLIGFSSLLLASTMVHAANPALGWYGGLMAGVSYATNPAEFVFTNPFTGNIATGNMSYSVLANGGLQVGYRCEHFHVEGQLVYDANYYNKLTLSSVTVDGVVYNNVGFKNDKHGTGPRIEGYVSFIAGFINAYYDLFAGGADTGFIPYVGLGIGYANIQNNPKLRCPGGHPTHPICNDFVPPPSEKNSRGAGMAQGIIGLNYWLDDYSSLALDYRYMSTLTQTGSGITTDIDNSRLQVQTINFVFNFAFDGIY